MKLSFRELLGSSQYKRWKERWSTLTKYRGRETKNRAPMGLCKLRLFLNKLWLLFLDYYRILNLGQVLLLSLHKGCTLRVQNSPVSSVNVILYFISLTKIIQYYLQCIKYLKRNAVDKLTINIAINLYCASKINYICIDYIMEELL